MNWLRRLFGPRPIDRNEEERRQMAAVTARSRRIGGANFAGGGILEGLRQLVRRLVLSPEEQRVIGGLPWIAGGDRYNSGQPALEKAIRLAPVFSCGRILASTVSSLPLHAYRAVDDQHVPMSSLPQLFQRPAVRGTLRDWLFRLMTSMAYDGNAFGLVTNFDGFGYPTGIEWLNPSEVTVEDRMPSGPGSYSQPVYRWGGSVIPNDRIVHIPWFVVAGRVRGLSPLGAYSATVRTGLSAQGYSADWFDSGGVPPGTFKNSQKVINQEQADQVKARLVSAVRSHEPIVYGADWDYNAIAVPPGEAAFVETLQLSATQIANIYGIPAEMVGGSTGGSLTYNNIEQDQIRLLQFAILPWLSTLEAAFFGLLPERQYVRFNVDALIRVDLRTRHEVYRIDRAIGLKNIDEIRGLEDLPPLPNGEGQSYAPLKEVEQGIAGGPETPAPSADVIPIPRR